MASKTAAVIPSKGIGDALLMMIASHHLLKAGYHVITYHPQLPELQRWFPEHHFEKYPPEDLSHFDFVIFENDNSPRIQKLPQGSIFYPTYNALKHGPLSQLDCVFNPDLPMADNIAQAIAQLLQLPGVSKDNGFIPPKDILHRSNERRIVLHPLSTKEEKNWPKEKYLKIAADLKKNGYETVFAVAPEELLDWEEACAFPNLDALASFLYESAYMIGNDSLLGHLASNMHIPTLIIANDAKRMRLWRPAWRLGMVITPSPLLPNWKGLRLRGKHWKRWISPQKVLRAFDRLSRSL